MYVLWISSANPILQTSTTSIRKAISDFSNRRGENFDVANGFAVDTICYGVESFVSNYWMTVSFFFKFDAETVFYRLKLYECKQILWHAHSMNNGTTCTSGDP